MHLRYINGEVKFAAIASILLLCACDRQPEFPVPEQRSPLSFASAPASRVLNMDDPNVVHRFVRDISPDLSSSWRWAFQRPAVKIRVRTDHPLKYTIDFAVPELTFRDTGPVTITFKVNDHVLDRVQYTAPGEQHFEKPVPSDWIKLGDEAIVGAEIDKMWTAKDDGKQFGFILTRIGLTR